MSEFRNISDLLNLDKVAEKFFGEMIADDMKLKMDPSQYGNQHHTSIQHYLVKMLHKILTELDGTKGGNFAVVASLIDWKEAFPRQCPRLGVEAFLKMGVRPSLIPMLINFFQGRKMQVKWHGKFSEVKHLNGSGPQGSTIGLLEYLAQSNNNADTVGEEERFKFLDDLSILEVVNLLTIGISTYDFKQHVASDIPEGSGFVEAYNLKSQNYINDISDWTKNQKMKLNLNKSNIMIFNPSKKYKFTTRVKMQDHTLPVITKTKLLGTIITDDLKWNENTRKIVKQANQRLQILRKSTEFTSSIDDLKTIYIAYVRSILEQSSVLWGSSLTDENKCDLERVQKNSCRIILGERYENYENALKEICLETLEERRKVLALKFGNNCLYNVKTQNLFPSIYKKFFVCPLRFFQLET